MKGLPFGWFCILSIFFLILIPGIPASPVYCPESGTYLDIVRVPAGITWTKARSQAESQVYAGAKGHLATITSEEKNNFILLNLGGNSIKGCWIGGFQPAGSREPDGGWSWVTGEPWDYTYWIGPPNNHYGGDQGVLPYGASEDVVQVNWWDDSGKWNDFPGDIPMGCYLIEYPAKEVPTTATTVVTAGLSTTAAPADTVHVRDSPAAGDTPAKSGDAFPGMITYVLLFIIAGLLGGILLVGRKKQHGEPRSVTTPLTPKPELKPDLYPRKTGKTGMINHDVMISYSTQDKSIADGVCAGLEARKIRCWIAPRDILPGTNYQEAIVDAIDTSRIMVLIFSSHSNESPHVIRELTRAVNKNVIIIPFKIEDIIPSKSIEYLISVPHWLEALTPPLEHHIEKLAYTINILLSQAKIK